jgi:restriction system protein
VAKRKSELEGWIDLIAKLPWWGGVALGVGSYLVLHPFSKLPDPHAINNGVSGATIALNAAVAHAASYAQYLVPLCCFVAAATSALSKRRRSALADAASGSTAAEAVSGMTWREFEMLLSEAFRLDGYAVKETGGQGADGGVDLELRRDGETYLVQCKHWKAFKVDVTVVRELYGVMAARGASGGYVVTSGRFTSEAQEFARGRNVRLMDGAEVLGMLQRVKARGGRQERAGGAATKPSVRSEVDTTQPPQVPACPNCQSPMVKRLASKGAQAGSHFWGCATFPKCRGTRQSGSDSASDARA